MAVSTGGLQSLLSEAWGRHGIPLVVSEVHIDATRNDHLRWIKESWDATQAASHAGVAVQGFTGWALLGSFDWNCLLTAERGYYEPGAFDLRAPYPRETAVAGLLRELAAGSAPTEPATRSDTRRAARSRETLRTTVDLLCRTERRRYHTGRPRSTDDRR